MAGDVIMNDQSSRSTNLEPTCLASSNYRQQSHSIDDDESSHVSPVTSPPYWLQSHERSASTRSLESTREQITLQDNTDGSDVKNEACWARKVNIEDWTRVNGNKSAIGAFIVWNITVETLHGGKMRIRKRYSEFDGLRKQLVQTFPQAGASLPHLPPKSVVLKFRPKFLEHRRLGLEYFLNCVILNPEFSGSPVVKDFLFL